MQTSSITLGVDSPYVARDDESEAAALEALRGTGDTIYLDPDEVNNYALQDFGLTPDEFR